MASSVLVPAMITQQRFYCQRGSLPNNGGFNSRLGTTSLGMLGV